LTSKKSKKEVEMNGDRMENKGIMDKGGKEMNVLTDG
jgi:hypothetical protein